MELSLEQKIRNKALELGYENCGIIPISDMKEYEEKLEERMRKFPECEPILKSFYRFANFDEIAPWAKEQIKKRQVHHLPKINNIYLVHLYLIYPFFTSTYSA